MPRNPQGQYTLPGSNPVITDTVIESDGWANPTMSDLGSEIENSLDRDGRGAMRAALRVVDGLVSAPGLGFSQEVGSGLYRIANGQVGMAILGALVASFKATGIDATGYSENGTVLNLLSHIQDLNIHYPDAPADGGAYQRQNNAWIAGAAAGGWGFVDSLSLVTGSEATEILVYHDGFDLGAGSQDLQPGYDYLLEMDGVWTTVFEQFIVCRLFEGAAYRQASDDYVYATMRQKGNNQSNLAAYQTYGYVSSGAADTYQGNGFTGHCIFRGLADTDFVSSWYGLGMGLAGGGVENGVMNSRVWSGGGNSQLLAAKHIRLFHPTALLGGQYRLYRRARGNPVVATLF